MTNAHARAQKARKGKQIFWIGALLATIFSKNRASSVVLAQKRLPLQ
jgi:hypothetical protein